MNEPPESLDGSALLRFGFNNVALRWRTWILIGHVAFIPVLAAYFAMVFANGAAFDYSFWFDIPPSSQANAVAVLSIWIFFAFSGFFGVIAYGWMCRYSLAIEDGEDATLWQTLRQALGPALRSSWYSILAFGIAALCVVTLLPGLVLLGLMASLPFPALDRAPRPLRRHSDLITKSSRRLTVAGAFVSAFSIPLLVAYGVEEAIRVNTTGWVQAIAVGPLWIGAAMLMVGAGAGSAVFARLYRSEFPIHLRPVGNGA